jgi:hypothetical protein
MLAHGTLFVLGREQAFGDQQTGRMPGTYYKAVIHTRCVGEI